MLEDDCDKKLHKIYSGKTTELYDFTGSEILFFRTDRISVNDEIFEGVDISEKGKINNAFTNYFKREISVRTSLDTDLLEDDQNELLSFIGNNKNRKEYFGKLSLNLKVLHLGIEAIARRYNVGSFAKALKKEEVWTQCFNFSPGLKEYDEFSQVIFTPSIKCEEGKDVNVTMDEMIEHLKKITFDYDISKKNILRIADIIEQDTKTVFNLISIILERQGLRLVDIKLEFGLYKIGDQYEVMLIDEISPDTMRVWKIDSMKSGKIPTGLDKDLARDEFKKTGKIPKEVVEKTSDAYCEFAKMILPEKYFSDYNIEN